MDALARVPPNVNQLASAIVVDDERRRQLYKLALYLSEGMDMPAGNILLVLLTGVNAGMNPIAALKHTHQFKPGQIEFDYRALLYLIESSGKYKIRWTALERTRVGAIPYMKDENGEWKPMRYVEIDEEGNAREGRIVKVEYTLREAVENKWTVTNEGKPKDNWTKYPKSMLAARVVREIVKFFFPEVEFSVHALEQPFDTADIQAVDPVRELDEEDRVAEESLINAMVAAAASRNHVPATVVMEYLKEVFGEDEEVPAEKVLDALEAFPKWLEKQGQEVEDGEIVEETTN